MKEENNIVERPYFTSLVEQKEHDIWNYPLVEDYFIEMNGKVYTDSTANVLWEYWYFCQKHWGKD